MTPTWTVKSFLGTRLVAENTDCFVTEDCFVSKDNFVGKDFIYVNAFSVENN